jgi:hypothetical protein
VTIKSDHQSHRLRRQGRLYDIQSVAALTEGTFAPDDGIRALSE